MNSSDIRQAFLDYFKQKNHQEVDSSSLVPVNDATLLFTNAGMVQFKDTFLGEETRPYVRAVSSQRCVRAGGKHNDLENVGYTARHHTFFEMLGNFSFGDYFKKDAIIFAWDFLTNTLKLPKEKLWVSVYQDDDEAFAIWQNEIGFPKEKISRCGEKDNFWSMGDTGPCGPCSEIFYDHGPDIPGGPPGSAEADGDRFIEIWNMVFMQFNRDKNGVLHNLPKPSVDTGMGLERITAVVQGVHNNYDIDIFKNIIKEIIKLKNDLDINNPSLKVIADHIRSCSFLIADGVIPSNEGRGYVLRRIIRRAIRHGHKLGLPIPFFYKLVKPLAQVMGDAYPYLKDKVSEIEQELYQEEEQFERTIDQGLRLLQDNIDMLQNEKKIPGEVVFKLYDTYGFPLDLTCDIAREQNLAVDIKRFESLMLQQRKKSKESSKFQTTTNFSLGDNCQSSFNGYAKEVLESKILGIIIDEKCVSAAKKGDKPVIILESTPFYAESGGQIGDSGQLVVNDFIFNVTDTQKQGKSILHYGEVVSGKINLDDIVTAKIDVSKRNNIRLNHTATHLLHKALKVIVNENIQQNGSLVNAEKSRFDFSYKLSLNAADIRQVENLINEQIRENLLVETQVMSLDDAKNEGAVALFGEKYSNEVRVLAIGDVSKELCGGTHAKRTGDIGLFKIVSESGIASGVRRIEFITGQTALDYVNDRINLIDEISDKIKSQPSGIIEKISQYISDVRAKDRQIEKMQSLALQQSGNSLTNDAKVIGEVTLLVKRVDFQDVKGLRLLLDKIKSTIENAVVVLYSIDADKIAVVCGISKIMLGKVPVAKRFVEVLCGTGGGRDDMAQGGGLTPSDLDSRLKQLENMLAPNIDEDGLHKYNNFTRR
ncbi:MAG: alanine--tRNA ligase [Legionellales bacterium RIFCSPHIGHO2_12_FULL_35_11]|nr:MAG: alanine--tRNA ligase [Legionellales bacterium RIFCSPHIGHO2_12_FULL_35_11]